MKPVALAVCAVLLGLAWPAASFAQSPDRNGGSGTSLDAAPPGSVHPHDQDAQLGSARDRAAHCQGLQQRADELWGDAERARDHGDFASARDQLNTVHNELTRECGH